MKFFGTLSPREARRVSLSPKGNEDVLQGSVQGDPLPRTGGVSRDSMPARRPVRVSRVGETALSALSVATSQFPNWKKRLSASSVGKALAEVLTSFGIKESIQERSLTSAANVGKASVSTATSLPT